MPKLLLALLLVVATSVHASDEPHPPIENTDAPPVSIKLSKHEAYALLQEVIQLQQWYEQKTETKRIKSRKPWRNEYQHIVLGELRKHINPDQLTSQTMVVVDRNPKVQHAWVTLYHKGLLIPVADGPISTGTVGRFDHYITPVGVFAHTGDIVGYRAEGTKNKHGVKGLGAKGMRVWDFGWQKAHTGWLKKDEIRDIRFAMHATDPDLLEQRLGRTASKGCVRVHSAFNKFMDEHAILDGDVIQREDIKVAKTLLSSRMQATKVPGRYLIVVDTAHITEVSSANN